MRATAVSSFISGFWGLLLSAKPILDGLFPTGIMYKGYLSAGKFRFHGYLLVLLGVMSSTSIHLDKIGASRGLGSSQVRHEFLIYPSEGFSNGPV